MAPPRRFGGPAAAGEDLPMHATGRQPMHEVTRFLQQVTPDYQGYMERTKRVQDMCLMAALDAENVHDEATLKQLDEQMRALLLKSYIAQIQLKNVDVLRTAGGLPDADGFNRQLAELETTTFTDGDYMRNAQYKDFRQKVWNVHHEHEPMPMDELAAGVHDDDDLVVATQVESYICPLTQKPFERPMKNINCNHSYSEEAIKSYISQAHRLSLPCPQTGCRATVDLASLTFNKVLDRQMKSRQASSASQAQPSVDVDDISEY